MRPASGVRGRPETGNTVCSQRNFDEADTGGHRQGRGGVIQDRDRSASPVVYAAGGSCDGLQLFGDGDEQNVWLPAVHAAGVADSVRTICGTRPPRCNRRGHASEGRQRIMGHA